MDRVKKIKLLDFFQPIINQSPYTIVLFIDFAHPSTVPPQGPIQKPFWALCLGAEASEFTNRTFSAHYTLV